jgi:hypothetical protein
MRMMGADSVEYHRQTVMGRADDFAGQALDYYSSRGETPLIWGGSGAARLGLAGAATGAQYAALYGPGGGRSGVTVSSYEFLTDGGVQRRHPPHPGRLTPPHRLIRMRTFTHRQCVRLPGGWPAIGPR